MENEELEQFQADTESAAFVIETRGSGLIGLVSCKQCGAAIIVGEEDFSAVELHRDWHRTLDLSLVDTTGSE